MFYLLHDGALTFLADPKRPTSPLAERSRQATASLWRVGPGLLEQLQADSF